MKLAKERRIAKILQIRLQDLAIKLDGIQRELTAIFE